MIQQVSIDIVNAEGENVWFVTFAVVRLDCVIPQKPHMKIFRVKLNQQATHFASCGETLKTRVNH